MHGLAEQIKSDFADLSLLRERIESGTLDILEKEQILQKISWIKQGLNMLKRLRMVDIEGVLWGELEQIKNDVGSIILW